MSRKQPEQPTKVVGARLPTALEQRAQVVAQELSRRASGVPVTLSSALTIIVARGLDAIEVELEIPKAKPTKSKLSAA